MEAIKPEINSCWRKLCPYVVHDFTEFLTEPIKEIVKEIVHMAKKIGGAGFPGTILEEDDLLEMSTFEPVPDNEEEDVGAAVLENRLTLDSLTEVFQLFETAFHFFYNMDFLRYEH